MAKRKQKPKRQPTPTESRTPEEVIRQALTVRKPQGGWPWSKKADKPKAPKQD